MECDSQKKIYVWDQDGSLTGKNTNVYIIPVSELSWDVKGEEGRGLGDIRIPAVMQTDYNGNRLPIDKVRPRLGEILCNYKRNIRQLIQLNNIFVILDLIKRFFA